MPKPFSILRLTADGRGAIGSLLLSGEGAEEAFCALFTFKSGRACTPADLAARRNVPIFGHLALFGEVYEEVLVRAVSPEEIEIHSHGGSAVRKAILRKLESLGGTELIEPDPLWEDAAEGEPDFSREAERILPYTRTELQTRFVLTQMAGAPARFFEQVSRLSPQQRAGRLCRAEQLAKVARTLYTPPRVLILGPVNAGKSSLLNAILGFDRTLVDSEAGTTRDAVSAETVIGGLPIRLSDTAGVRRDAGALERQGIERIAPLLADALLRLTVFDLTAPGENPPAEFAAELQRTAVGPILPNKDQSELILLNKCDLPAEARNPFWKNALPETAAAIETSVFRPETIEGLLKRIRQTLFPVLPEPGEFVPLNAGQLEYCRALCTGKSR